MKTKIDIQNFTNKEIKELKPNIKNTDLYRSKKRGFLIVKIDKK